MMYTLTYFQCYDGRMWLVYMKGNRRVLIKSMFVSSASQLHASARMYEAIIEYNVWHDRVCLFRRLSGIGLEANEHVPKFMQRTNQHNPNPAANPKIS